MKNENDIFQKVHSKNLNRWRPLFWKCNGQKKTKDDLCFKNAASLPEKCRCPRKTMKTKTTWLKNTVCKKNKWKKGRRHWFKNTMVPKKWWKRRGHLLKYSAPQNKWNKKTTFVVKNCIVQYIKQQAENERCYKKWSTK